MDTKMMTHASSDVTCIVNVHAHTSDKNVCTCVRVHIMVWVCVCVCVCACVCLCVPGCACLKVRLRFVRLYEIEKKLCTRRWRKVFACECLRAGSQR